MKRHGRPENIVPDCLRSYNAALKDLGLGDDREMGRWRNNRAKNSHLPFRRRELIEPLSATDCEPTPTPASVRRQALPASSRGSILAQIPQLRVSDERSAARLQ